jgi:uncharacterized damage-inducible protein DinB
MTRLEMLFHIINHRPCHRGAISRALDLAGVPHPAGTYMAYIYSAVYIHAAEPERRERARPGIRGHGL